MRIPDFAIERYFAHWEFEVPHHLSSSALEPLSLGALLALADPAERAAWEALSLGYTEGPGLPALRAAIAGLYESVAPEEVLVFTGAEEAIFALANVVVGPGDHAAVLWPAYQSLHEVARAAGADVSLVRLRHDDGWRLDLETLRGALRPNTRFVVVNYPHSPTGALVARATFEAVVQLADEAGATLLSDEVYRLSEHEPLERLPAAVDCSRRAVSLGVMSKSFGLAGLRIGWIATHDAALRARLAAFKDYLSMCNSAPSEWLALIALRARDRVLARTLGIVRDNLRLVDRFFEDWSERFEWVRPRAGGVGFPRLRDGSDADAFAAALREEQGVLVLPGSVFDHGDGHFRLGFGLRGLPDALAGLRRYAERHLRG